MEAPLAGERECSAHLKMSAESGGRAMLWALAAAFLGAFSSLVMAAWHQATLHKGPYEYCLLWYLGAVIGVVGAIALTVKRPVLTASFHRFPLVARCCLLIGGACVAGLGAVFALLGLKLLLPQWFSSGPVPVRRGFTLWLVALALTLVLGLMGLAGIVWGLALMLEGIKGPVMGDANAEQAGAPSVVAGRRTSG
jgi:hypothetical protein